MAQYAKAGIAAVVAGLSVVATSLDDGGISAQEWLYAAIALLTGLGAVWATPNAPSS